MALGTQTPGKMFEYEQYIDYQISQTQAKIRMTDVLTAAVTLIAVALGVLFLEILLDHMVGLPTWLRATILGLGLLVAGGFAVYGNVRPLLRKVNLYYVARTIE